MGQRFPLSLCLPRCYTLRASTVLATYAVHLIAMLGSSCSLDITSSASLNNTSHTLGNSLTAVSYRRESGVAHGRHAALTQSSHPAALPVTSTTSNSNTRRNNVSACTDVLLSGRHHSRSYPVVL